MESVMYVLADREYKEVREAGYQTVRTDGSCLRAIYTIWKTARGKNIGICCHDRYFIANGRLLTMAGMEALLQEHDIVLSDQDDGRPMLIVKKEVFDKLCMWLFAGVSEDVLAKKEACEALIRERNPQDWMQKQHYKICRRQTVRIDMGRMAEMYALIEDLTAPLVLRYQRGCCLKLSPLDKSVGRGGRMPVWICWWQGLSEAPDLVCKCVQRIQKYFTPEKADVRIVTFENYRQYVEFSETIVQRFRTGALSLTHLSDVLRAQLLCRYGGLWIDATYYIWDERYIDMLLQFPFFTQKQGGAPNELDIISGRWANNFMKGPANFPLFGFMVEAFELYWKQYDVLKNYFLFDYIIAIAYDHLREIRSILEACPVNNAASQVLAEWCNNPYDAHKMAVLTAGTWLFKMTNKKEYVRTTENGEKTFYGVLMERE